MKLIACGYNGCVYDNGKTVVKLFNSKKALVKNEIEFGVFVNKYKDKLALLPLLSHEFIPGSVKIPFPPGFDNWEKKYQDKWKRVNIGNTMHVRLEYPKIMLRGKFCTFKDMYWKTSRKLRYQIMDRFLNTLKLMGANNWYNDDIHSNNIVIGDSGIFMIDYGAIGRNTNMLMWSLMALVLTFSCWPEFQIYPNTNKPKYNDFVIIKKSLMATDFYKDNISILSKKYKPKLATEVILELLWTNNPTLAGDITGYTKWLAGQPESIKKMFGKPHNLGILPEDAEYAFKNLDNIDLIIKRVRSRI
jgi:hypothetical protein